MFFNKGQRPPINAPTADCSAAEISRRNPLHTETNAPAHKRPAYERFFIPTSLRFSVFATQHPCSQYFCDSTSLQFNVLAAQCFCSSTPCNPMFLRPMFLQSNVFAVQRPCNPMSLRSTFLRPTSLQSNIYSRKHITFNYFYMYLNVFSDNSIHFNVFQYHF